jgi:hypothetical protein
VVAVNIELPNIRKFFVPDPGFTICDADLSGADAQVVAWESGDEDLKAAFRSGVKIHVHNARAMFSHETKDLSDDEIKKTPIYRAVKAGCHACNYGARAPALVANVGWTLQFAEEFRERWFHLHPAIWEWHQRIERYLHGQQCWNCDETSGLILGRPCPSCGSHLGRTVKNAFGYRRIYFERVDHELLNAALAWGPQSTVAFCTELGWTNIAYGPSYISQLVHGEVTEQEWRSWLIEPNAFSKWHNIVQFLVQVHDSIVFQVPHEYEEDIPKIVNDMLVRVPYKDPLIIPMGVKHSRLSWGDCE